MTVRVRFELWSEKSGEPKMELEVGSIYLRNISKMADISDYEYQIDLVPEPQHDNTLSPAFYAEGVIENYVRKNNRWHLVNGILNKELPALIKP